MNALDWPNICPSAFNLELADFDVRPEPSGKDGDGREERGMERARQGQQRQQRPRSSPDGKATRHTNLLRKACLGIAFQPPLGSCVQLCPGASVHPYSAAVHPVPGESARAFINSLFEVAQHSVPQ